MVASDDKGRAVQDAKLLIGRLDRPTPRSIFGSSFQKRPASLGPFQCPQVSTSGRFSISIYAPPAGANAALADGHTTATYLIDRDGRQRVLWTGGLDNAMVGRDLRILLGIPVSITLKNAAPEVGHPAPAFSLDGAHGGRLSLAAFHGKVVLLNFWATWCKPCRSEMPQLAACYRQEQRRGLVVLGVDMEEPRGDVLSFLQQLHIPYPVGLDESGSISGRYQVNVLPVSFLIDRHGTVQSVRIGVVDSVYRMTQVQPLLNEQ